MDKINRMITPYNRTKMTNKQILWLVIHYVGAVSTAKANALYFYNNDLRGTDKAASCQYFVDEIAIWQSVEDFDASWQVGAKKYFNGARNTNAIGIEMCCKKKDGQWYIEPQTIKNTIELAKMLMKKYNIPIERVCRHYDVTHKICPEPFVRNPKLWEDFLKEVNMPDIPEASLQEKEEKIKEFYGLDDNTVKYFEFYRYNTALIDKLYNRAKNSEK